MKISPVFIFSNSQTQNAKRTDSSFESSAPFAFAPMSLQHLQANFNVKFRGAGLLDKITPPTFEDETLNSILQRCMDVSGISTKDALHRSEDNAMLTGWYIEEEGLKKMQAGEAYPEMVEHLKEGIYDGVSFEERDKCFMYGVQRLIDSGAIDDKTFVLIDTGHSIPIAAQLMKEENRAALGNVKGAFLLGDESAFPKTHPCVNENDSEQVSIYEQQIRNKSHYRLSSQILTFGDIINDAYKNSNGEKGALFIGVDCHRNVRFDISKLPTVDELKKLGLNKVAIVQEMVPLSSFSQSDFDKIFTLPLTMEKIQDTLSRMRQACDEAEKTPADTKIDEASKETIRKLLTRATKILRPNNGIDKIYPQLDPPNKKRVSKLIEKREFGYGTKICCGSDMNEYLKYLKKNAFYGMEIFVEGATLLNMRGHTLKKALEEKNKILARKNKRFDAAIRGDFDGVCAAIDPSTE